MLVLIDDSMNTTPLADVGVCTDFVRLRPKHIERPKHPLWPTPYLYLLRRLRAQSRLLNLKTVCIDPYFWRTSFN